MRDEEPIYHGGGWTVAHGTGILGNERLIGTPARNKTSRSRRHRIVDGQNVAIDKTEDRARDKRSRKNDRSQQLVPDSKLYPPIVDPEVFKNVQHRLNWNTGKGKGNTRATPKVKPIQICSSTSRADKSNTWSLGGIKVTP